MDFSHHLSQNPTLVASDSGGIRRLLVRKIHLAWKTMQNMCYFYNFHDQSKCNVQCICVYFYSFIICYDFPEFVDNKYP